MLTPSQPSWGEMIVIEAWLYEISCMHNKFTYALLLPSVHLYKSHARASTVVILAMLVDRLFWLAALSSLTGQGQSTAKKLTGRL
jgi:formate-dependent nitrite reductase membrane component NrfD